MPSGRATNFALLSITLKIGSNDLFFDPPTCFESIVVRLPNTLSSSAGKGGGMGILQGQDHE
jgi:hypothetical protein